MGGAGRREPVKVGPAARAPVTFQGGRSAAVRCLAGGVHVALCAAAAAEGHREEGASLRGAPAHVPHDEEGGVPRAWPGAQAAAEGRLRGLGHSLHTVLETLQKPSLEGAGRTQGSGRHP